VGAAVVVAGGASCAGSPAERAAQRGDLPSLRAEIDARERIGRLTNSEAAQLARTVAGREVGLSAGPDAVERVRDARPCAHELDDALAERSRTHDAAGAHAALARIETGSLSLGDARAFARDGEPPWRAVATRAFVRAEDREARHRALLDPEPLVRRAAARAARDAQDPADLEVLADAARVDPMPIVRTEAVRALAAFRAESAGRVVDVLRDLWQSGDDGLREDIALAWSAPALWAAGGRDALNVSVASQHGPPAIEAAAAVLRHREADPEVSRTALAQLERAIESGSMTTRLQAIAQAPVDRPELAAAVKKASAAEDLRVRVAALARLAESKDSRVTEELEALARRGSTVAEQARFALATAGDRRIQAWVEEGLSADRPEARLAAATELASLGLAARGAPLLADADPSVRVRAACTILMAYRVLRP
jgi:hypothetical protein